MENLYVGREQSQAKHAILSRYLTPFANKILSTWKSIDFIDGFSGPWKNVDTVDLSDTSIGVALRTLSSVAEVLGHSHQDRRIRCIFNEANPEAYRRLDTFIRRRSDDFPLLKLHTFQGEFEVNAASIRSAANHEFQLLFIDPTGYTGFPPSSLALFNGRSSEIIINFMRSFIERFVSGNHEDRDRHLAGLIGEKRARYLIDTGLSIQSIENEYLSMLRGDLGYRYAGYSPIHNPDRDQIHFNLAYATNHFAGMEVMRCAEFAALSEHDRNRFTKSLGDTGGGLFGDMLDEMEITGPYLRTRKRHIKDAQAVLEELVNQNPRGMAFGEMAAIAQQTLYLRRSELGDVVVKMAEQGVVQPSWRARNGRKPKQTDQILPL